ncbi:MAG TPA: SDR family oxidoreductase [Acidimicrobiales bacterium]|nr:SDR family oxidoreductase [Acidimicrobiales bacterium]
MDLGLADRTYLVTGGSRGLGYATAAALVEDGANVVLSSRDPAGVAAAAASLGDRAVGLALDNADPATPEVLISTAFERWGRLDGALVSVGGPPPGPATGVGEEQWRQAFESVFLGTLRLATAVGARVGEGGAIALVLSSSVRSPLPNLAISNGLRPGLAMAAKDLADELGPSGVRVFGLLPGRILTDRTRQTVGSDPEALRRAELLVPLRRLGRPEEFGRVAAMLLSPAASYVTGCVVPVDGGMIRTL